MAKFSVGDLVRVYHERGISNPGMVDRIEANGMLQIVWNAQPVPIIERMRAHPKQCRLLRPRKPKVEVKPIDWAKEAFDCLNHGVELMPVEQLSQWTGVRAVIESYPEGSRVISKAELEKAWDEFVYRKDGFYCNPREAKDDARLARICKALGFESEGK